MEKKEIADAAVKYGGRMLLYGGTVASLVVGARCAMDFFTGQFVIPQIYSSETQAQVLADIMKNYHFSSLQEAYQYAKGLSARSATGFITLGALGLTIGLHEDWNSIKNFVGKVPNKFSSKVIDPIKERVLRRNVDYVAAMNYNCQV